MRRSIVITVALVLAALSRMGSTGFAAGQPASVAVWTGSPQSAATNTTFGVALVAIVRDAAGNGVQGATVTFAAPASGASAAFGGATTVNVTSDNNGAAIAPTLTANGLAGSYGLTAGVAGVGTPATFSLTNTGGGAPPPPPPAPVAPSNLRIMDALGTPASVIPVGGTPQATAPNTTFPTAARALVRNANSDPMAGITVTFTAPGSGASASFAGSTSATAVSDGTGVATAPALTANGVVGSYLVTASVPGATSAAFSFTNSSGGGGGGNGWTNVTPGNVNLSSDLDCGNFGTISVVQDPARPSNLYTHFDCQGIWKSTDFGQTWAGPINTGSGAAGARGAGGIAIARGPSGQPPILYSAGIRGSGMGFWRSTDGGVSWTNFPVGPGGGRQDFYPPVVDPYNVNHLIMNGHEMNLIVQSVNGGQTWTAVPMAGGMNQNGGTGFLFFVDTGNPATTATTWLWTAQATGGLIGTWRTSNGGGSWTQVDKNEHPHGEMQIYQPDSSGVVYMAGVYSQSGWGLLRSTDYGQTWAHVGTAANQAVVFGTPNTVYGMYAWACGHCTVDPVFQFAPQPGTAGWTGAATPPGMNIGAAQAAVVFDGSRYVIVTANWLAGLWRYVE